MSSVDRPQRFPVFFPVSRELDGEEFARDWILRHSVRKFLYKSVCQPKSPGSGAGIAVFNPSEIPAAVVRTRFHSSIDYFLWESKDVSVPR